ncbi:unnamed protein product [Acanthoscelides obtectus]|nr:unnamed protein product [Acanthoscelides obtectus]CAK1634350.1 Peroxisome biogenesis factor 1 [Acanthoscelides obtectus]
MEKSKKISSDLSKLRKMLGCYEIECDEMLGKFLSYKYDLVCRMVQTSRLPFLEKIQDHCHAFNVFFSKSYVPKEWAENSVSKPLVCHLKLLSNEPTSQKSFYVKLLFLEDIYPELNLDIGKHLFVHDNIFHHLKSKLGARVVLKTVQESYQINKIEILTKRMNLSKVVEKFKEHLAKYSDSVIVLNKGMIFEIEKDIAVSLNFDPPDSGFCLIDNNFVRQCKYDSQEDYIKIESEKEEPVHHIIEDVGNFDTIVQSAMDIFSGADAFGNVLIIGQQGTGKSSLLRAIQHKVQQYPKYMHIKMIKCKSIKGKTMDSLERLFQNIFHELVLHQPSLLVIDDLHVMCENIKDDESAPNAIYFNRISEMFHNFLKPYITKHVIGICATSESLEKLNKNMYSSRGSHVFKNVFTISELDKQDRQTIMKHLLQNYKIVDIEFDELSVKTDGFVFQDMVNFCEKVIYEGLKHSEDDERVEITMENCEKALENTCILSLENVNLHSPGDRDFSHIGGLHDVKQILVETLLWPVKYPQIFADAPLRLQSGLLLYGPPGTGKTMLAGAAAKQCRLRIVTVKGPELLSKYIGASEQAVRDVFQKAQRAKPCILFFDEFDSLAPRRGHDNTGVTDRVVNQFLTQLDGIESLVGVCVLAATSRPDLLDPALLRPGRLDRQILCPLPNKAERLEILKVISKNLDLAADVDLEEIAKSTEHFSGADLQSLMYTAQMFTVDVVDGNEAVSNPNMLFITQEYLRMALKRTRPSLPSHERLKYDRIYEKFHKGAAVQDFEAGKKATLA